MALEESKHMFSNIQRKQRLIDEVFRKDKDPCKTRKITKVLLDEDKIFNTKFIDSVLLRHGNDSQYVRDGR